LRAAGEELHRSEVRRPHQGVLQGNLAALQIQGVRQSLAVRRVL